MNGPTRPDTYGPGRRVTRNFGIPLPDGSTEGVPAPEPTVQQRAAEVIRSTFGGVDASGFAAAVAALATAGLLAADALAEPAPAGRFVEIKRNVWVNPDHVVSVVYDVDGAWVQLATNEVAIHVGDGRADAALAVARLGGAA